jgi:hypothetical protein
MVEQNARRRPSGTRCIARQIAADLKKSTAGNVHTNAPFPTMTTIAQLESFDVVQESNTKFAWQ